MGIIKDMMWRRDVVSVFMGTRKFRGFVWKCVGCTSIEIMGCVGVFRGMRRSIQMYVRNLTVHMVQLGMPPGILAFQHAATTKSTETANVPAPKATIETPSTTHAKRTAVLTKP